MAMTSMGAKGAITRRDRSSSSYVFMPNYTTQTNKSQAVFTFIFIYFFLLFT
jgi:hypothetical protein